MSNLRTLQAELHSRVDTSVERLTATFDAILRASALESPHKTAADALAIHVLSDALYTHTRALLSVVDTLRENRTLYSAAKQTEARDALCASLLESAAAAEHKSAADRSQLQLALSEIEKL
jgi:hypothetical protein